MTGHMLGAAGGFESVVCVQALQNGCVPPLDMSVLNSLKKKSQVFDRSQEKVFYALFSKSGFTQGVIDEAEKDPHLLLFDLNDLITY